MIGYPIIFIDFKIFDIQHEKKEEQTQQQQQRNYRPNV